MKKGNLLIVDDEELIVDNLRITLEDLCDRIFTAHNGVEALEIILQNEIHCIICDINMPRMNGVELIKEIRSKNMDMPFIFYTGHGNVELMKEAAKYGAFDFLDKPNLDGLLNVIKLGLEKGFSRSAQTETDWHQVETEFAKMLKDID